MPTTDPIKLPNISPKMRSDAKTFIDTNPELKEHFEGLPQDQKEGMKTYWAYVMQGMDSGMSAQNASKMAERAMKFKSTLNLSGERRSDWDIFKEGAVGTWSGPLLSMYGGGAMGNITDLGEQYGIPGLGQAFGQGLTSAIQGGDFGQGFTQGMIGQVGGLPGDVGEFFTENPWATGVLQSLVGGQQGGGGYDLSGLLSGLGGGDINLGGILGSLGSSGGLDDILRQIGIPLALGYLGKEEAEPWQHMAENALYAQMGLGDQMGGMFNQYIGGGDWDWGAPTMQTGAATPPTSAMPEGQKTMAAATTGAPARESTVGLSQLLPIKESFGSVAGDPNFNPAADYNQDNKVDMSDILWVKQNYGGQMGAEAGDASLAQERPGIRTEFPIESYAPTQEGISPYEQLVKMQAYGMMNPLGQAEEQARIGRMYDRIGQQFDLQREQIMQRGAQAGQPQEIINAQLAELDRAEGLERQTAARDVFTYGQELGRDYQSGLASTLSPMFGMPGMALGAYGQAGATAGQMAGDIGQRYSDLAGLISYGQAMAGQPSAMDYMQQLQGMMGQQGGGGLDLGSILGIPGATGGIPSTEPGFGLGEGMGTTPEPTMELPPTWEEENPLIVY